MERQRLYIDGTWMEGTDKKTFPSINPATGEHLAARRDELARVETMDMGKPLRKSECDVDDAIHCFRYYAGLIRTPEGGCYEVNKGFGEMQSYTAHEPIGVCALITPWNYPLLMGVWKIAPSLAAGNSIIYKPASNCVLTSVKLFEILEEAGIPKGAANLVLGPGGSVGDALAESPDVDMVAFTGSTAVGQSIMKKAAGNVKKVGLELGGKSPNIIFADTDLEADVEWAMIGIFMNQGEICSAGSRILVEESIHDAFVNRLVERANAMTIGNPLNNPDIGAMVCEGQLKRVPAHCETGKKEGAKWLCGGERYTEGECAKGYFIRPTVFDTCTGHDHRERGDLRAGGHHPDLPDRGRGDPDGKQYELRPGGRRPDKGWRQDPAGGQGAARRHHLGQLLQPELYRGTLGRLQDERHRAGTRHPRAGGISGGQAD